MAAQASRARPGSPPQEGAGALRIEEITTPAALSALSPEWTGLFEADPRASPFQSPQWLLAWRRAFLPGGGLWTLAVRGGGGELLGLAPFFLYRDGCGGRQLTLLGNGVSDRLDVIARPEVREAAARAVARRIARPGAPWDSADLRDLPEGSPLLRLPLGGVSDRIEPEPPSPALDLPAAARDVIAALPRSRRTDLRRCARRLAEIAPVSFTRADAGSLAEHLDALVGLHTLRWRERGEAGALADPAVVAFHADAAADLQARGLLRLDALRLGGRIVAVHYGLRRGACGYSYLHAFDPRHAAFGPGWLLLARCLEAAVGEGVRRFDFLRGREAYKYAWGAADQPRWRRRIRR